MASAKWVAPSSSSRYIAVGWWTGAGRGGVAGSEHVATIDAPGIYTIDFGNADITNIGSRTVNASDATLALSGVIVDGALTSTGSLTSAADMAALSSIAGTIWRRRCSGGR